MKYQIAWSLLAVMAVGCGEVSPKDSDPDAGPDAPPQQEKTVKVRVTGLEMTGSTGNGQPDPNAVAIFLKPDGTVAQAAKVNAQGEAEMVMAEGSTVQTLQVAEPTATTRNVYIMTFHDVKPGDVIAAGLPRTLPNTRGPSTTMTGNFNVDQAYTTTYYSECGGVSAPTSPVTFTLYEGCHGSNVDILGIQTSVATPPGPSRYSITRPNYVASGNFPLSANWQNMANFVATMSNLPDDISSLTMRRATFMRAGAAASLGSQFVSLGDPPAGAVAGSIPYPAGVGTRALVSATLNRGVAGTYAAQVFEVQTADVSGAETLDYNGLSVPWVGPLTYSTADRALTWTESASGSGTPDIRVAALSFRYTRDNINYSVFSYEVSRPTATATATATGLPTAYAEFDPAQQAAATFQTGILAYVDQDNLNGYDEARQHGIAIISGVGTTELFPDKAYRRRATTTITRLR